MSHGASLKKSDGSNPLEARAAETALSISRPTAEDGARVHDLVAACPPLDENSLYANLLQCTHFANTCALASAGGELLGWVSGYIPPGQPEAYFLWQVAVHERARGQKLPKRLIADILQRPACTHVQFIKTSITPDNAASWRLFQGLARWLDAPLNVEAFFDRDAHFKNRHDSETLVTIGPFHAAELRSRQNDVS